jgi:hypothetical protein
MNGSSDTITKMANTTKKALEESILREAFRLPLCWVYETDPFGLTFLRLHSALTHTWLYLQALL